MTCEKLEFIDLAIIVPLEEELLSVMEVFPSKENRSTSISFRHLVEVGSADIKCLVVQQAQMGRTASSQAASEILGSYDVGMFICLGIAGSLSGDMNLADVCYTGTLLDVYDNSKTEDLDAGGIVVKFSPTYFDTPTEMTQAFNFIRTQPELQSLYKTGQTERSEIAQRLAPNPIPGRANRSYKIEEPKTMCGTIVCGSVSKSKEYNEALTDIDRRVLAIETESGGLFTIAKTAGIPAITIRGMSDYADRNKAKLEADTAGIVRTLAAGNAATFLKTQLTNPFVLSLLKKVEQQHSLALLDTPVTEQDNPQSLPNILSSIKADIDLRLRELCPEYKLQAAGYRLPIPRARRREASKAIEGKNRSAAFEIRAIIATQKFIVLDLPRAYPDQALPWMVAHDLLTMEIEGKQTIPLVVDGKRLSAPRTGLSRLSGYDIENIKDYPGVIPVVIVDDCPLFSKTRMKFLLEELEKFPDLHFV